MLQSMGLKKVRHNLVTEQQQQCPWAHRQYWRGGWLLREWMSEWMTELRWSHLLGLGPKQSSSRAWEIRTGHNLRWVPRPTLGVWVGPVIGKLGLWFYQRLRSHLELISHRHRPSLCPHSTLSRTFRTPAFILQAAELGASVSTISLLLLSPSTITRAAAATFAISWAETMSPAR